MAYLYDLTDTWNAAGTVFNAIKMNVTNTASAAGSKIVSLQVGATDRFTVDKDGNGYLSGTLQAVGSISSPNAYLSGNSGTIGMQDNTASILAYNATGSGGITNTLRFITAATERVRIDGSGNVGIGVTPVGRLTIQGAAGTNGINQGIGLLYSNGTQYGALGLNNSSGWPQLMARAGAGLTFHVNSDLLTTGEAMRIDSSGNVGIGTSSPASKLNVSGGNVTVSAGYGIAFSGDQTRIMTPEDNIAGALINWASGGICRFVSGSSERMRIDSSGNVGIGTSSPWERVSVPFNSGIALGSSAYSFKIQRSSVGELITTFSDTYDASTARIDFTMRSGSASQNTPLSILGSGNVGIGTTSPGARLEVAGSSRVTNATQTNSAILITSADATGSNGISLEASYYGSGGYGPIKLLTGGSERMRISSGGVVQVQSGNEFRLYRSDNATYGSLKYLTGSGGLQINDQNSDGISFVRGGSTESMRLDASGNLLVGTTNTNLWTATTGTGFKYSPADALTVAVNSNAVSALILNKTSSSTGNIASFRYNGGDVGTISISSTATTYNTSSDARLKENVAPADDAADLIDAIQVRKFDWKADGSHQRYGFVAQELLEVAPEAVSVPADENEMMGVDYSKLVPMLVKELQSVRARLAMLEGKA